MDEGASPVVVVLGIVAGVMVLGFGLSVLDAGSFQFEPGLGRDFSSQGVDLDGDTRVGWLRVEMVNGSNITGEGASFFVEGPTGEVREPGLVCQTYEVEGESCREAFRFPWSRRGVVAFGCEEKGVHRFGLVIQGGERFGWKVECGEVAK